MAKKTSTKKTSKTVYVVTTHEQMDDCSYEGSSSNVVGVYTSREAAEKVAYGEATEYLEQLYCERAYFGGDDEEYQWGEWDDLPDTEAERTEDDDFSKEGIFNAIRAVGGNFRVTDADGNFYELAVSEEEIIGK